jgi:hypothetical protein
LKIPNKLDVAGITYKIKQLENEDPKLHYGSSDGIHDITRQLIILKDTLEGDYKNQVLCHEVVHAICDVLNISNETICIDERFVESFSQILYQVIKQL